MRYIFNFPDIGEGLEEGTIAEWYVEKGQTIEAGDPLCKMETDKVVTDIPSPKAGIIVAKYGKVGDIIKVREPLVEIEIDGVEGDPAISLVNNTSQVPLKEQVKEEGAGVVGTLEIAGNDAYLPASQEGVSTEQVSTPKVEKKALATPVARAVARDLGVEINQVKGTGPVGRVMKEDIYSFMDNRGKTPENHSSNSLPTLESGNLVDVVPLTQMRKTIAKNMLQSKQRAAHMTVFDELDAEELMRVKDKYNEIFKQKNVKLSYLPFVLKATALALKKFKEINAEMDLDNNCMIYKNYYNIGIAVDAPDGLVVPVIRNVDRLSIFELAQQVNSYAEKARNKQLTMDDMKDGTFTITSFGSIGGIFAVPVINFPQIGILGVGRIVKKAVVKNDMVVPGNILPLSISVDHCVVDGGLTARFLNQIMRYLEDPVSMIME